ncbi:MAG: helix-turn-helix transcriptional regulator [Deltaproteobacteria bacterium]|nr:helix-turn-helix transcriptional regulator [Deltaproteobacteria bacterium]
MNAGRRKQQSQLNEVVRQRIRRLRAQRQFTQELLCERAGISVDAVSRIEGGSRVPTLDTLERIARALGIRVVDLVSTAELPREKNPPSIQRIVNLLEPQSTAVHKACEKVLKIFIRALTEPGIAEGRLAAEEKTEYVTLKKK